METHFHGAVHSIHMFIYFSLWASPVSSALLGLLVRGLSRVLHVELAAFSLASLFAGTLVVKGKECEVAQSCLTLCDPMDCSPPNSSVHGILQARILKWVAISFSRGSSQPRDLTLISCIAGEFLLPLSYQESPSYLLKRSFIQPQVTTHCWRETRKVTL